MSCRPASPLADNSAFWRAAALIAQGDGNKLRGPTEEELVRLVVAVAALVLSTSFASAAPIIPAMTVGDFFATLEEAAAELAEGGMEIHAVRCSDDGAMC